MLMLPNKANSRLSRGRRGPLFGGVGGDGLAFDPMTLSPVAGYDDRTLVVEGSKATGWGDHTGTYDAAQGSASLQPDTSTINGLTVPLWPLSVNDSHFTVSDFMARDVIAFCEYDDGVRDAAVGFCGLWNGDGTERAMLDNGLDSWRAGDYPTAAKNLGSQSGTALPMPFTMLHFTSATLKNVNEIGRDDDVNRGWRGRVAGLWFFPAQLTAPQVANMFLYGSRFGLS